MGKAMRVFLPSSTWTTLFAGAPTRAFSQLPGSAGHHMGASKHLESGVWETVFGVYLQVCIHLYIYTPMYVNIYIYRCMKWVLQFWKCSHVRGSPEGCRALRVLEAPTSYSLMQSVTKSCPSSSSSRASESKRSSALPTPHLQELAGEWGTTMAFSFAIHVDHLV